MSTTAEPNFCGDIDIPAETSTLTLPSGRVENNQLQGFKAKSDSHSARPTKPRSDGVARTSASRKTGFVRDTAPALAAPSDPAGVLRRNRRNSTPAAVPDSDTGRAEANELVDISISESDAHLPPYGSTRDEHYMYGRGAKGTAAGENHALEGAQHGLHRGSGWIQSHGDVPWTDDRTDYCGVDYWYCLGVDHILGHFLRRP
ncbi:hypothetical protein B0H11DRAFT_2421726 [Mycena galericulata]|nr:hypothetical protein B0H11DRAFT_2421726 [Mycena galericulata]